MLTNRKNPYFTTRLDFSKTEQMVVTSHKKKVERTIVNIYWALTMC